MLTKLVSTDKNLSDIYINMNQVMDIFIPNNNDNFIHITISNGQIKNQLMLSDTYKDSLEKAINKFNTESSSASDLQW